METKENNIRILTVLVLVLCIVILSVAYARYVVTKSGSITASMANFDFDVTAGNSLNLNIDLAETRYSDDTLRVARGEIAPDTKGAFCLNINAEDTKTALIYNIDLDLSEVPENLKFYSDSEMKKEVMVQDNKIKIENCIEVNENQTQTINLYWMWPYETGENEYEIGLNDEKDSSWMGRNIQIEANVKGRQNLENVSFLADNVLIGDYVNYDATSGGGNGLNITPDSSLTGSETLTTFYSGDITGWRVFDVDSVTKTVTLIANEPTERTLTLFGKEGVKNSVSVLNSIGAIFGYGVGAINARSIQEKDILVHSNFIRNKYSNNNHKSDGVSDGYYYYNKNSNKVQTESYSGGRFIMEDNSEQLATSENIITMKETYYWMNGATFLSNDYYKIIFKNSDDVTQWKRSYWVAGWDSYLYPSYCQFGVRNVREGAFSDIWVYASPGYRNSQAFSSVVPIVVLKSNIKTTGKDSNQIWLLDLK